MNEKSNIDLRKLIVSTDDGTIIRSDSTNGNTVLRISGVYSGGEKPKFHIHTIRGTHSNPETLRPGDFGASMGFTTYFEHHGEDIGKSLAAFIPQMDVDADPEHPAPASNLNILVNCGDGNGEYANDYRVWRLNKNGALESKIFQCVEQDAESINNIDPKNGMIIYNSEVGKFQGYANGSWIDLH
jgi:hypothetical protein